VEKQSFRSGQRHPQGPDGQDHKGGGTNTRSRSKGRTGRSLARHCNNAKANKAGSTAWADPAAAIHRPDNIAPSGLYTNTLAHHPILHPSNTNLSSSSVQSRKSKSKRATSPAKTCSDLLLLKKPAKYGVMDAERDDLLEDIRVLIEFSSQPLPYL
jgi:hypothetical protein